jgi:hypothetical protein
MTVQPSTAAGAATCCPGHAVPRMGFQRALA